MLYAKIAVGHKHLVMDGANSSRVTDALATVFGTDQRVQVIGKSPLFGPEAAVWQQRICFGCFHMGYSMLCWRDRSDQLQVHMEMTPDVRFQDACLSAYRGVRVALSSELKARPRLESLEVVPFGDTKPVLFGETGFGAHFRHRATLEPVIVAIITAAVVGVGGWWLWSDQAASLWSGAAAAIALGVWGALVAIFSCFANTIRWVPGR